MYTVILFLQGIGFQELLLIGVFILIFFGAKRIPEFMKSIGKGVREYKDVMSDMDREVQGVKKDIPKID
ncbi:MAG TPA: twin-arginine translocase TatA/TatE family subunit [Cyclobacteriaceae bacterium]